MNPRVSWLFAVPAVPLAIAAVQPRLLPAMASHAGWYATALAFVILGAIAAKRSRDGTARLLTDSSSLRRLVIILVSASATVPLGTEVVIDYGRRVGWYREATTAYLHVLTPTVILLVVTIEVIAAMQRLDALREASDARLRLQIERMPIAYLTIGADFRISSWSPAAERIFGWSEREIIGQPANVLVAGGKLTAELDSLWQRLAHGDDSEQSINENIRKDGRVITCRWSNTPVFDAKGTMALVITMAEDITREQRALRELLQTQERWRELVNSLPHYVFSVTNDDRYVAVNSAMCEFYRRPESEILGRTPQELGVAPEIARRWLEQKSKTRLWGMMQTVDGAMTFGGQTRQMRTITSPMRDEHGQIFGVTGIAMDITEQKEAEAAMHWMARAVEQVDEVMFTTDSDGAITYVNPAFEKVYGYTKAEAIGQTPRILKSGEISREEIGQMWSRLQAGRSVRAEYRNRRKDGSLVDVVATASPLFDDEMRIRGFVAVQQDVTDQKRTEAERAQFQERLERMAKMEALGTLAGGMAHDFNNILSIILTHATLLERNPDPARTTNVVSTVKQAVQRGASLSRQILTFARRAEIKAESLDTTRLIMEVGSMISETFPRTIHLTLDLEPDVPQIRADAGQIHQALLNLCLNARDAMPDGGELRIETRHTEGGHVKGLFSDAKTADYVCIVVSDTGVGMDAETQRRIFEPFFTTKPKGKGTGLGLAMTYGVVNSHGGIIDVESAPGEGTSFRLYFPVAHAAATTSPKPLPVARVLDGRERLLIVDDEAAIREGLSQQLQAYGYAVVTACDGPEAIGLCLRDAPHAVVMDLGMPKLSPAALVDELRRIAPGIPVIAMTGYIDHDVHDQVVRAGVDFVLQKPFDVDDLMRELRQLFDQRAIA